MNFKQKIFLSLFAILIIIPVFTFAQELDSVKPRVSFNNTQINKTQDVFNISFDIGSDIGGVPELKYGVLLAKQAPIPDGVGFYNITIEEKTYEDIVLFDKPSNLHKEISYNIPNNLDGKYTIWLIASYADNGQVVARSNLGSFDILSSVTGIFLDPESCLMSVEGDKSNTFYGRNSGVDIAEKEKLITTCDIQNNTKNILTLSPYFNIFRRNIYSEKTGEALGSENITILQNEKKKIQFVLPTKDLKPQAYDISVSFKDLNKKNISNEVVLHIVRQGFGATVQELKLDKNYYEKGESATVYFFWTPSADLFFGSRTLQNKSIESIQKRAINYEINILQKNGDYCSEKKNGQMTNNDEGNVSVKFEILQNCIDPIVEVLLMDGSGNILDQMTISYSSEQKVLDIKIYILIGILVLLGLFLTIFGVKYIKKVFLTGFFLLLFLVPNTGLAYTEYFDVNLNTGHWGIAKNHYILDISGPTSYNNGKYTVYPNTTINIYASLNSQWICGNGETGSTDNILSINGKTILSLKGNNLGVGTANGFSSFQVPINPGIYTMIIYGKATFGVPTSEKTKIITYEVLSKPNIDGPSVIDVGSNPTYNLSVPNSSDAYQYNISCRQTFDSDINQVWSYYRSFPYPNYASGIYSWSLVGQCSNFSQSGIPFYLWVRACTASGYCSESNYKYINFNAVVPTIPTCTSFTYSACKPDGTQDVLTSLPAGCTGGSPVTTCTYTPPVPTCTSFTYSACKPDGTRDVITSLPAGCTGGSPVTTCTYIPPVCTSWTYSGWASCQLNNKQIQVILSSSPAGCAGGTPDQPLSRDCVSYERISLMGKETGGGIIEMAVVLESSPYFDSYPLKIRKGGKTYGIVWTGVGAPAITSPAVASKFKVRYKGNDYSIVKFP